MTEILLIGLKPYSINQSVTLCTPNMAVPGHSPAIIFSHAHMAACSDPMEWMEFVH